MHFPLVDAHAADFFPAFLCIVLISISTSPLIISGLFTSSSIVTRMKLQCLRTMIIPDGYPGKTLVIEQKIAVFAVLRKPSSIVVK